ncbi:MAG: DUF433 domain-containing protein [Stellaceae bacterium]
MAEPSALAFLGNVDHAPPMLDWSQCPEVERIPGKVSGAWLFKNSRVPVKALFENIEGGATVQDFLEWFPGVTRKQVDAVLDYARRSLDAA